MKVQRLWGTSKGSVIAGSRTPAAWGFGEVASETHVNEDRKVEGTQEVIEQSGHLEAPGQDGCCQIILLLLGKVSLALP